MRFWLTSKTDLHGQIKNIDSQITPGELCELFHEKNSSNFDWIEFVRQFLIEYNGSPKCISWNGNGIKRSDGKISYMNIRFGRSTV